jgi:hypothetical protein
MSDKAKKTSKKQHTIQELLSMRDRLDDLLAELCPPCPECCPPDWPGDPGEIVDHGKGEISICEHCWGRGYMEPDEGDDG